jgi:hypothetical protein
MLSIKASVAAAIIAGTAAASAGTAYLVTRASLRADITASCLTTPTQSTRLPAQTRSFPPLGNVPSTTGGKQW